MFFPSKFKSAQTTYILTFALCCILMLLFVDTVFAQSYTPISPLPGVGSSVNTGGPSGLVQYFNNIFVLFISIIAVLAVIKLMICGFQYMMSEAISSKEAAKKCMTGVFGGLLIVLLSVLVLQTINPKILSFDFFGTLQDKVGGVVSGIELDDRSRAETYCFTNPGFVPPEEFCGSTLQSCNDVRDGLILAGASLLTPCVLQGSGGGRFELSVINNCTENTVAFIETSMSQCSSTLENILQIPRYTVVRSCYEEAGSYRYTVEESGSRCSGEQIDRFFPYGPIFNRDGPCEDALEIIVEEKNYRLNQACRNVGP